MRTAFVHDWLVTYRGGEKVLEALLELYPEAPIYTLFYEPSAMPPAIRNRQVYTPRWLSAVGRLRKLALPVLPRAVESFDLSAYDLVISTSSCVAKGARPAANGRHLCYLHSPMRYIWDQQDEYLRGLRKIPGAAAAVRAMTPRLRRWDVTSADRVDAFVVNSSFVRDRTRRFYGRDARVVPPPVDVERFRPLKSTTERSGYLLAAGALVSYKRFDLAIRACETLGRRLVIAGAGPMESSLRRIAGAHTEFVIDPDDETFTSLLQHADGLLFPGVEDFGMIAIEAMSCGTPVIAQRAGGALDFVHEGETGLFFDEPSPQALCDALSRYEVSRFDGARISDYASRYGISPFANRMREEIQRLVGAGSR